MWRRTREEKGGGKERVGRCGQGAKIKWKKQGKGWKGMERKGKNRKEKVRGKK